MQQMEKSRILFERAKKVIPGGVNSPVRAFGSVGADPLFIARAQGAYIWDADGNSYIDFVNSWGPMILGHRNEEIQKAVVQAAENGLSYGAPCEREVEMAELVARLAGIDCVRMVSSGTEAVMSALRLARGFTGRKKLMKFEGCYHGHSDSMLVKAGSGALTSGTPNSAGVPESVAGDTLTAQYNDLDSVERLFAANKGEIAALIVEPVAANMGLVTPKEGFLQGLRSLCDAHGALLVIDEVITGFRLALGGAQSYYGVRADLVTYGKIIGGGLPVGAFGGRRDVMNCIAPAGPVYQAGTLSGNPAAMAAGLCQLQQLEKNADTLYPRLEAITAQLAQGLCARANQAGIPAQVNQVSSLCCAYFTDTPVTSYTSATSADVRLFADYFKNMLARGVYLAPSQFETMFISAAHTPELIEKTLDAAEASFAEIAKARAK